MKKIVTGYADLDAGFTIMTNDESRMKKLISNLRIRELIKSNACVNLQIRDDGGRFGSHSSGKIDELSIGIIGISDDARLVKYWMDIFHEALNQLEAA